MTLLVDEAAVAGVEPATGERRGRLLGLAPVAGHDRVRPRQHLAVLVDLELGPDGGGARPHELAGALVRGEVVPLGAGPVDREHRRGLGQTVDLQELPTQLRFDPLDGAAGRGCPCHHDPGGAAAGQFTVPLRHRLEDGVDHGRGGAQERHPVAVDPTEDLGAVDLAQRHLGHAHGRRGPGHAPPVGVEHRQGVEVDVTVGDAGVPAEHGGVHPAVPVCELHSLRPGRRARRVVDGGGGRLVGLPRGGLGAAHVQFGVALGSQHVAAGRSDAGQRLVELGVDQDDRCLRVLEDVPDLGRGQSEVDRDQDPAPAGHPEERGEEPSRVVGDDGHPLAGADAESIETGGLGPCPGRQLGEGQGWPRFGRLLRLVDDGDPAGVGRRRTVQEVTDVELDVHGSPSGAALALHLSKPEGRGPPKVSTRAPGPGPGRHRSDLATVWR